MVSYHKCLEKHCSGGVNTQKRADAAGIVDRMWTFNFIFHVEALVVILEKANDFSQYLQKTDMGISTAASLVEQTTSEFIQVRDNSFTDYDESSFAAT